MSELKQKMVEEKKNTIHDREGDSSSSGSDSGESEDNLD